MYWQDSQLIYISLVNPDLTKILRHVVVLIVYMPLTVFNANILIANFFAVLIAMVWLCHGNDRNLPVG